MDNAVNTPVTACFRYKTVTVPHTFHQVDNRIFKGSRRLIHDLCQKLVCQLIVYQALNTFQGFLGSLSVDLQELSSVLQSNECP